MTSRTPCRRGAIALLATSLLLAPLAHAQTQPPTPPPAQTPPQPTPDPLVGVAALRKDASAVLPTVTTDLARAFLTAPSALGPVTPRTIYRNKTTRAWFTKAQADALPPSERAALEPRECDEQFYYTTKYGSPIAYARAIDLLAAHGFPSTAPDAPLRGKRILDFGYGGIGHLQLLAIMGAAAVGVDVDPLLPALYCLPTDQGPLGSAGGSVTLVHGRWPADTTAKTAIGGDYDLIISKNTLKQGYIHPKREVDKRMLVDLGVTDEQYLAALHEALKPGGYVIIYNLCPAPAPPDKPYIPWADGQCPFPKDLLEKSGFQILALDTLDDDPIRTLAHALGWDSQGMDLTTDLFAWYTILKRN